MTDPFAGQIQAFAINWVIRDWAPCDGTLLQIAQNQGLFWLLGTIYGGDGAKTFALPDLRSRTPVHRSNDLEGRIRAFQVRDNSFGGLETFSLMPGHVPGHTHTIAATVADASVGNPIGGVPAKTTFPAYSPWTDKTPAEAVRLSSGTIASSGGDGAHGNLQPYTTVQFLIALHGTFPVRN